MDICEHYLHGAKGVRALRYLDAALGHLGSVLFSLGRNAEARASYERWHAIVLEIGDRVSEGFALLALSIAADSEGDKARALTLASKSLALRREIGDGSGVANTLVQLGEYHWRAGAFDAAREALREALELSREQQRGAKVAEILALLACLPGGDAEAALAALEEVGESANTQQVRYYLWRATGDPAHLDAAKRIIDGLVEHAPEDCRASLLQNVQINREVRDAWEDHGQEAASWRV